MESCRVCQTKTEYICCKGTYYCNPECMKSDWSTHGTFCLGRSKIVQDESERYQTKAHTFYLNDTRVAKRAIFRLVQGAPMSPLVSKLLEDYGLAKMTHFPKLEIVYDFKWQYEFLKYFSFSLRVSSDGNDERRSWNFREGSVFMGDTRDVSRILRFLERDKESPEFAQNLFDVIVALKNNRLPVVADEVMKGKWKYKSHQLLIARILLEIERYPLVFIFFVNYFVYSIRVDSLQDYVINKMKKLHHRKDDDEDEDREEEEEEGEKIRESSIRMPSDPEKTILLTIPDFDAPLWPLIVKNYVKNNASTYSSKQLLQRRYVTFIARKSEYEILGYVTCSLLDFDEALPNAAMNGFNDSNLKFIASPQFKPKIWPIFSIDGLHVNERARGGRENSIATLLIYHALYYIKECVEGESDELGDILIASNSYARTTMLILKQFGFTHTYSKKALEWMESDKNKSNLMSEVMYYIDQHKAIDTKLVQIQEARRGNGNPEAWEMIKKLRELHNVDTYDIDYEWINEAIEGRDYSSFLALSATNNHFPRNEVFENEMERITNLIQERDRVQEREKRQAEDFTSDDDDRSGKRPKFSAIFSHNFMELL